MTASEEKYWMENYPKEAETIITLCKLFDELVNDDASKAQLDYVIGLLRRKEEGRLIELPVPIGEECWVVVNDKHIEKRNLNFDTFSAYGNGYIFSTREEAEAKLKERKEKK